MKILNFPKKMKLVPRPDISKAYTLEQLILSARQDPTRLNAAEKAALRIIKEAEAVLREEAPHLWDAFIGGRLTHVDMALVLSAASYRIARDWIVISGIAIAALIAGLIITIGVILL